MNKYHFLRGSGGVLIRLFLKYLLIVHLLQSTRVTQSRGLLSEIESEGGVR